MRCLNTAACPAKRLETDLVTQSHYLSVVTEK
ncbi:MAG: hypothetical protein QOG29_1412 [Gaiellaceae bacterium]|nr:hypothetical protein [Gaiellaceae bacterium]